MSVREISIREALNEALHEEMLKDPSVILLGEDIRYAMVSGVTAGLVEKFGNERVIDTPISEEAIAGVAVGMAIMGMRPVAEVMFAEFLPLAMNQIINAAAKFYARSHGNINLPMVIRTSFGVGAHGQNFESIFAHIPGLKVVIPSTPYDAKGLLKSAIRDNNPVLFFESRTLYTKRGPVPMEDYIVPLGVADIKRYGDDATIVATGLMVHRSLGAAEELSRDGINVEVIDLRTVRPLDKKTLINSVKKTGRLIVTHESWKIGGVGAEVIAQIVEDEEGFNYLQSPPHRVCTPDVPLPDDPLLEFLIPSEENIVKVVKKLMGK
ncbi:MAG: alpha-ketoacid dehydrogenase subunit beta [Candidatus Bathyarchaeia archaeon]